MLYIVRMYRTFTIIVLLFLVACGGRAPEAPAAADPRHHFTEAEKLRGQPEHLPLAIWHYERFLDAAAGDSDLAQDAEVARMQLELCRERYLNRHETGASASEAASVQALTTRIRLLEERTRQLGGWIGRLERENRELRQALLSTQQGGGQPTGK